MSGFKVIEDGASADYEFEATAQSIEELFETCGQATFAAMTEIEKVKPAAEIKFEVQAATLEDLLFSFLSELVYIKDTQRLFLSKFDVAIDSPYHLTCRARGERIDENRHVIKTDVKAATYHEMKISKTDSGYYAHAILDL